MDESRTDTRLRDLLTRGVLTRRDFLSGTGRVALGLAATSTLAACLGSSQQTGSVRRGGVARIAFSTASANDVIDPPTTPVTWATVAMNSIYDQLIVADNGLQPQPGIASSWELSSDFKTWTFHIRKGVEFHDGTKLTSKDVAYSIKIAIDPKGKGALAASVGSILKTDNVTTPDAYTVQLALDQPNVFLYTSLFSRFLMIVKEGATSPNSTHIGTGPFIFKEFVPGHSFRATRNPNYWQQGKPYLDEIRLTNISEAASQYQALVANQVDLIGSIDYALAKPLKQSADHDVLVLPDQFWPYMVMDDRYNPIFANQQVVQAIKLAVDRQQIIDTAYSGFASIGYDQPVATSDPYFDSQLPAPKRDLAGAKSMLKDAGYANGVDIGELIASEIGPPMVAVAQVLQQQLAEANIRLTVRQWPSSTFWDDVWLKKPASLIYNLHRHPAESFRLFYFPAAPWAESSFNGGAGSSYSNDLKAAVVAASSTSDLAKQKTYLATAERIAAQYDKRLLPAFAHQLFGINRKLKNVHPSVAVQADFRDASMA